MRGEFAISYIRFSSDRQLTGDSLRRQLQTSAEYAERNGLIIDETVRDLAVSAYSGDHRSTGAFGNFLRRFRSGEFVHIQHFLVESLDRMSREAPRLALPVLLDLINAGITVHTLIDERVYSAAVVDRDPMALFQSLVIMGRANEESASKSIRVKCAKGKAVDRVAGGEGLLTRQVPGWLSVEEPPGQPPRIVAVPERVEIVRQIFRWNIEGHGFFRISHLLNDRGTPSFGRGREWGVRYVEKILNGRAVLGELEPRERNAATKGRPVKRGVVLRPYPPVIDQETYDQALAARAGRKTIHGPKGLKVTNLFAGLCWCAVCGSKMRVAPKQVPYLICNSRYTGSGCSNRAHFVVSDIEKIILDEVWQIALDRLPPAPTEDPLREIDQQIVASSEKAAKIERRVVALLTDLDADLASAQAAVKALQAQKAALDARLSDMRKQRAALNGRPSFATALERLRHQTRVGRDDPGAYDTRIALSQGLRGIMDFILFDDDHTYLWSYGGFRLFRQHRGTELLRRWSANSWSPMPDEFEAMIWGAKPPGWYAAPGERDDADLVRRRAMNDRARRIKSE